MKINHCFHLSFPSLSSVSLTFFVIIFFHLHHLLSHFSEAWETSWTWYDLVLGLGDDELAVVESDSERGLLASWLVASDKSAVDLVGAKAELDAVGAVLSVSSNVLDSVHVPASFVSRREELVKRLEEALVGV